MLFGDQGTAKQNDHDAAEHRGAKDHTKGVPELDRNIMRIDADGGAVAV